MNGKENMMFTLKFAKQTFVGSCLLATVLLLTMHTISAQAPTGDIETNPFAPSGYDANLKVNDMAIAVPHFTELRRVRIVAKSDGAYKTVDLDDPRLIRWFRTNSVYPYFDKQAFNKIMYDYGNYVKYYLPCYAKKHNLEQVKVTGDGYFLPGGNYSDAQQAKQALQPEQPKLAEMESILKNKLQARPNTFLTYQDNPAIADEIASNRVEYMQCVVESIAGEPSALLPVFLEDIQKAKREAESYAPGRSLYLVSAGAASEALLRAVSPKAREAWAAKWLKTPTSRAQFNAAWDDLATIAAKKIPTYKPNPSGFQFRYPDGENLLMNYFKNPSNLKIFRIGTDIAGWNIQKDGIGLPSYRYKIVRVYLRNASDDHPYCHVVSARVKQDYAGGGTFKAEAYRSSVAQELVGCP